MKWLLAAAFFTLFTAIASRNLFRDQATEAYAAAQYHHAVNYLDSLAQLDSAHIHHAAIAYNKGQALLAAQDTALPPLPVFMEAGSRSGSDSVKSMAFQQAAVLHMKGQDLEQAIATTRTALVKNPNNHQARYNLELLLRLQQQQQQNKDKDQNQNQENKKNQDQNKKNQKNKNQKDKQDKGKQNQDKKDQQKKGDKDQQKKNQNQDDQQKKGAQDKKDQQKDKSGQGKDQKEEDQKGKKGKQGEKEKKKPKDEEKKKGQRPAQEQKQKKDGKKQKMPQPIKPDAEKLRKMGLSEERVKAILEALRSSEVQYLQQMKRKPEQAVDPEAKDW